MIIREHCPLCGRVMPQSFARMVRGKWVDICKRCALAGELADMEHDDDDDDDDWCDEEEFEWFVDDSQGEGD